MSFIKTNTGRTIFKDAESMLVMPYVYNSTLKDYVLGDDIYDLSAIIGDSIVIEQTEGNTTTKENEFTSQPLLQNVSGGKYGFTAQILDLQDRVLKAIFSVMTVSGKEGLVAFNADETTHFALIKITFADDNTPDVIIPKAQLNSRLFIQQLKSRAGQGNISGIACPIDICVKNKSNAGHLLQFSSPNTYVPTTPVLFTPQDETPLFAGGSGGAFYEVNFSTGAKSNIYIDGSAGTWSTTPI